MSLVDSMADTAKQLKAAKSGDGGYFYFVGDSKGVNAALMVFSKKKDADGAKTFRQGRGLLKDFKAEHSPAVYSQGEILVDGSALVFSITKGNAKPAVIKRSFKSSELLHEGVGNAAVALLKGARIEMASGAEEESESPPSTSGATAPDTVVDETARQAWLSENADLVEGMSPQEIAELFAAEKAFAAYAEKLPLSEEEDTALQIRQAETEAALESLSKGQAELELLKATDPTRALKLENTLNNQRVALAQKNAVGPDPFSGDVLSDADREVFTAALRAGLELLLARVLAASKEITAEKTRLETLSPEERSDATKDLDRRRSELQKELNAIQQQLSATTAL